MDVYLYNMRKKTKDNQEWKNRKRGKEKKDKSKGFRVWCRCQSENTIFSHSAAVLLRHLPSDMNVPVTRQPPLHTHTHTSVWTVLIDLVLCIHFKWKKRRNKIQKLGSGKNAKKVDHLICIYFSEIFMRRWKRWSKIEVLGLSTCHPTLLDHRPSIDNLYRRDCLSLSRCSDRCAVRCRAENDTRHDLSTFNRKNVTSFHDFTLFISFIGNIRVICLVKETNFNRSKWLDISLIY